MAEYSDALFGSVTYDSFSGTAVRKPEPAYSPALPRETTAPEAPAERPREKVRVAPERAPARRQYISVFAVIGTLCTAAVMVMILFSYINLNKISHQSVQLQQQIQKLEEENKKLTIAYESAFKLEDVEKYAMSELGMVKAEASQIMYINNGQNDRAEILGDTGVRKGADKVMRFLRRLMEYLK